MLVSPTTTLNRDAAQIGDDVEPVEESGVDVETRNEEEEESLEAAIPTIEMNPKNSMSREEQEHEDCGHAVYKRWCAAYVEGRGVMVKRERRVVNGQVPQHILSHFLSISSKILIFTESFRKTRVNRV